MLLGILLREFQRLRIPVGGYQQARGQPRRDRRRVPAESRGGIQVGPVLPHSQVFESLAEHDRIMHAASLPQTLLLEELQLVA